MTPNQHTMLNRLIEKLASVPPTSHAFVRWVNSMRTKNPHIKIKTDDLRRLISLHGKLVEQGLVDNLEEDAA
jgi:hypothetical protein